MSSRRQFVRSAALVTAAVAGAGCLNGVDEEPADLAAEIEAPESIDAALSEGYRSLNMHVSGSGGGLGEVLEDPRYPYQPEVDDLDPTHPEYLYYRLTESGEYQPAGVGWSISREVVDEAPSLLGNTFHGPEKHPIPTESNHYGLSAWVFEDNPNGLTAPLHPDLTGPSWVDELEKVRSIVPELDEEDGYIATNDIIRTDDGLYGTPLYKQSVEPLDPTEPPILLYRVTEQWEFLLMGVEWYVPAAEYDAPPSMFSQAFHEPMERHSHEIDQPEHFGLHAWFFEANPDGMFSLFNRNPQLH